METRYIIISPVQNEEEHIEKTLRAVIAQTVQPLEWVIANDGSTDQTKTIVESYCRRFPWIRLLNLSGGIRRRGSHIVDLVYKGLEVVRTTDFDFIVKLDGDVSFEKVFFATMFAFFQQNPRLGITSGNSLILRNSKLIWEKSAPGHTLGATKVYRKQCFDEIGGFVPSMGWDGIDEIKARMKGWEARPVPGLMVLHHRPEGRATGLFRSGIERGRGSYFMGYHPLFLLIRACRRVLSLSSFLDGMGMLVGYFSAFVKREERIPDEEFIRFLRKNQLRRLLTLKGEV